MKKSIVFGLMLLSAVVMMSCSNSESYTDKLNKEKKAIDKLFDDNGFVEIKSIPNSGVFAENEFYKTPEGVYINIIDHGDMDKRAEAGKELIFARMSMTYLIESTAEFYVDANGKSLLPISNYGPNSNGLKPVEFVYGYGTYKAGTIDALDWKQALLSYCVSTGLQVGLQYVGHLGKVRLIVPFKVGSSDQQNSYDPIYFDIVQFTFANEI